MISDNDMFNKFKENLIKKNKYFLFLLILLAILVGFLNGLPHILRDRLLINEGKIYHPHALTTSYDIVNVIGPRIKDVLDGHYIVSEIDLYEYKDYPPLFPPLSPLFYLPYKFFTQSIEKVLIISDFLFPVIIFFLFFIFYYYISNKRKWLSLFFTALTSLYSSFGIHIPPPALNYLKTFFNSIWLFTDEPVAHFLIRRESVIPTLIPFLLALIFCYLALTNKKKKYGVIAGIFYALNAYSYPFHFIYLSASLGILFIFVSIIKNKHLIKQLLIIFFTALVFLIPFLYMQIELWKLPHYEDIFFRQGVELGRSFRWAHWQRYLWSIILSLVIWFISRKQDKKITYYYVISFLLSSIIVLNIQIFLGFAVETDHWLTRDLKWGINLAYFVLIWQAINYFKKKNKFFNKSLIIISIFVIASLIINSVRYSYAKAKTNYREYTMPENLTQAFDWLNHNTPNDSVVMTPSLVSNYLIPYYTHNRIYIPRALNSYSPEVEALERLYIAYKTFNIKPEFLASQINPQESERGDINILTGDDCREKRGNHYLFNEKYSSKRLDLYTHPDPVKRFDKPIPEELYEDIMNGYSSYSCDNCLYKYKVDYLFYGSREKNITEIDLSSCQFLLKVYDNEEVEIYKVLSR